MLELIDRRLSIDLGTCNFGGVNLKIWSSSFEPYLESHKNTTELGSPVQIKTLSWNLHF